MTITSRDALLRSHKGNKPLFDAEGRDMSASIPLAEEFLADARRQPMQT